MSAHPTGRASTVARKIGYLVAVLVNGIMLVMVNAYPGWRVLPFLTEEFVSILWLVNLSLVAGIMLNLDYLAYDPAWFRSVGQIGVSAIGLVAALRMWQVFPFDISAYVFTWTAVIQLLLALAIFGSAVAIVVELVRLASRGIAAAQPQHHQRP